MYVHTYIRIGKKTQTDKPLLGLNRLNRFFGIKKPFAHTSALIIKHLSRDGDIRYVRGLGVHLFCYHERP